MKLLLSTELVLEKNKEANIRVEFKRNRVRSINGTLSLNGIQIVDTFGLIQDVKFPGT